MTDSDSAKTKSLAVELARRLFMAGDGPKPCTRLQFMAGDYRTKETAQGGFCESALAAWFESELKGLLVESSPHSANEQSSEKT